ncbi:TPA: hypothetical protein ACXJEZ_003502 [Providencia rettgeri]
MSPYISGFLIFLIVALYFGAFLCLLKNKSLNLNEESLDKQPLFWFAVLSPIVLFLIFGVIIWKDYIPDLSKEGLDKFAEISKFPLAVLALSPIFGVIVSNIHRTIQTKVQIDKTEIQISETINKNISDGYYSHVKYITEELSKIKYHISIVKLPFHFISFDLSFFINRDESVNIENEKYESITIELNIAQPKNFYHYIFRNSNMVNGYRNDINTNFITDSTFILKNLEYICSGLREYLVIDNAGNPIDILHCYNNRLKAELLVNFFNANKLNEFIPNNNFNIKPVLPNTLRRIIENLYKINETRFTSEREKENYENVLIHRLGLFIGYYGEVSLNYTKFIYHIISVIELNENEIFNIINKIEVDSKRLLMVRAFCDKKTKSVSEINKMIDIISYKSP